jgi:hypothetical protein
MEHLPQISMTELIDEATNDTRSVYAANWIKRSKEQALAGGSYPSQTELTHMGLTEANYLLLTGAIFTVPGGAASPLTNFFLSEHLKAATERGDSRQKTVLLMDHGSLVPTSHEAFKAVAEQNWRRADGATGIPSGTELHLTHLHSETSCGVSEGSSLITRRKYGENLIRFQQALDQSPFARELRAEVRGVEAYVGRQIGQLPGNHAFDVHDANSIYYLQSTAGEMADQLRDLTLPDYSPDQFTDLQGFNNQLRQCMDEGRLVIGQGCLDRRQGLANLHPRKAKIYLDALSEEIKRNRHVFRKLYQGDWPTTGWQMEAHTEAPLVVLNIGNDEKMTRLAYWMMTHSGAINRSYRYLAPSAPAIINVPESMFDGNHQQEAQTFSSQVTQLVANLDRTTYGSTLMGHNRSQFYVEINGILHEVVMPSGLQIAHSARAENYIGNLQIPKWFYSDLSASPIDLNPKVWKTLSTRNAGPVIE